LYRGAVQHPRKVVHSWRVLGFEIAAKLGGNGFIDH
jgi:hypothetical protein